jgi:hypothetical protein
VENSDQPPGNSGQEREPSAEERRLYEPPRLVELGTLSELTWGGGGPEFDDAGLGSG